MAIAAIDFGGTLTDVVLRDATGEDRLLARPSVARPDLAAIDRLLSEAFVAPAEAQSAADARPPEQRIELLAVTGGRSRELPERWRGVPVVRVEEGRAIAAGGEAAGVAYPTIVVSLGTGTALVLVDPPQTPRYLVGSGIGGGTLIGLSRMLLDTTDVATIGRLASAGSSSACDLLVGDIIGDGIGVVPADATAGHFARLGRRGEVPVRPEPADIAAALLNLIGQAVLRLAFEAAMGHEARSILLLGHLLDVPGFRDSIERIPRLDRSFVRIADDPGFAVARGALAVAQAEAGARQTL